jgi:hypothetical protein
MGTLPYNQFYYIFFLFSDFVNNHSDVKVASQTDVWTDL